MVKETRGETLQIGKITDYVERIVPEYSRNTFKEHFRFVQMYFLSMIIIDDKSARWFHLDSVAGCFQRHLI